MARRISAGMVICPLLVTAASATFLDSPYSEVNCKGVRRDAARHPFRSTTTIRIEKFDRGRDSMNAWLRRHARRNHEAVISRVTEGGLKALRSFSLASSQSIGAFTRVDDYH
jgi:hypothetical protein